MEHLDFALVGGVPAALSDFDELAVRIVGLAGEVERSLYDLRFDDGPVALVVGGEEKGLAPLVRRRCSEVVAIPQGGTLPSLNVAVAGAVACFEVARQRSLGGRPTPAPRLGQSTYAATATSDVQKAHRRAAAGMSLRRFRGVRASRAWAPRVGSRLRRRINAVSGTTTARKTTVATMRNASGRR